MYLKSNKKLKNDTSSPAAIFTTTFCPKKPNEKDGTQRMPSSLFLCCAYRLVNPFLILF